MARDPSDLHIVMVPWSAFGHMIPFYQLGLTLAEKSVRVSYISTSRNIERLPKIPSKLAPYMEYVSLPLPTGPDDKLPQGAEATIDLQLDEIPRLKVAYDLLYGPIKEFVRSHSPDWMVTDVIAHWMPEVTKECHVPMMLFSVFTATFVSFMGPKKCLSWEGLQKVRPTPESLTAPPPWGELFPPSIAFHSYEAAGLDTGFYGNNNVSKISDAERYAMILEGCDAASIRSCIEYEGEYIDLFKTLIDRPMLPVGLLPPPKVMEGENLNGKWIEIFKWLDQQSPRLVIYVGFGREYKLTKDEVFEIAYGLELAQLPFI